MSVLSAYLTSLPLAANDRFKPKAVVCHARSNRLGRQEGECKWPLYPAFIIAAHFSPIIIAGAFVFALIILGMIDASATRRPLIP